MGVHMFTAATTASGAAYNPLVDTWIEDSEFFRRVARLALAGSAAAGDITFSLKYGDKEVALLTPTTIGAVYPDDDDFMVLSTQKVLKPHSNLGLVASGNATTNSVFGILDVQELVPSWMKKSRVLGYGAEGCGLWMYAFASSALETNLSAGRDWYKTNVDRKLVRMGLIGGAGAADAEVDVSIGSDQIAHLINFQTGAPEKVKWIWNSSQKIIPAGVPLNIKVTNAFTSTKTFVCLDIKEVRTSRGY